MNRVPELLVPAGSFEKMQYALAFGADAVYAGIPQYSLRARENDFKPDLLSRAISETRELGKRLYLTMNIFPHNRKIKGFEKTLKWVAELNPDGIIMADPGMIMYARETYPDLTIHLSTQANAINWMTVKFWHQVGVKRIILSRELTMEEIREIRQRVPDIELETFVHGAICMAYSGRCLLSNYFNHRDANQGVCSNACRWDYKVYREPPEMQSEDDVYLPLKEHYYLEESERPGTLMPVDEDEHGTYIMNAKDLSAIDILPQLVATGIDSIKVEGRTKSLYYVSTITRAYRRALDLLQQEEDITDDVRREVNAVANRGYVTGFLEKNPLEKGQNYESGHSKSQTHQYIGIVNSYDESDGMAVIKVRNRFETGDSIELITPGKTVAFRVNKIVDMDGNTTGVAHGGGKDLKIRLPEKPSRFALLRKNLLRE